MKHNLANSATLSKLSKRNVIPFPAPPEEVIIFELGDDVTVYAEEDPEHDPPKEAA